MNNVCDPGVLPQSSKQSASFTDQKLRKENTIFKMIHLLTAETNVSMVLHLAVVLLKSDRGEKTLFWITVRCSHYPSCCFVSVETETIYLEYIQQCFSTVFHLQKWRKSLLRLLQIVDIPYWILKDFDMVNLEIVFYPFMTVAWVPHPPPLLEET